MSSEDPTPLTSRPASPLSTDITPPGIDTRPYGQPPQATLTPLSGNGPASIAITPFPGATPQLSSMPFHLPHGFGGNQSPYRFPATDILPTPEEALRVSTMPEVRKAIDTLDHEIVTLLGTRLRFIEAAARIKEDRGMVRDEWRKEDVIDKAVARAGEVGMDEKILRCMYEALVEGCIEYEGVRWDEFRKPHPEAPEVVLDE